MARLPTTSQEAWNSEEFRAFALIWLGFDPKTMSKEINVQGIAINMKMDMVVTYELQCQATEGDPNEE